MNGFKIAPCRFGPEVTAQIEVARQARDEAVAGLLDFASRPRGRGFGCRQLHRRDIVAARRRHQLELEFADPMEQVTGHLYFLLDSDEDQSGFNLEPVHSRTAGHRATCVFQAIDMAGILQACFVTRPVTLAKDHKTRLVRLTAGA
ncbi:MAG: hypothetical protein WDN06_15260 [Asticcacaulis sp.]